MATPKKTQPPDVDNLRKLVRECLDSFHPRTMHPLVRDAMYTNIPRLLEAAGSPLLVKLWHEEVLK